MPDEKWGSKIVLKIEGNSEGEAADRRLIEKMGTLLHSWEVPKEIIRVAELERTSNGKIKR